jgi:hypothetical protein
MEEKRKEERFRKENEVTINIVSEDSFIPVEEWSKLQELSKKDEIPQEGDSFIPVEEWSKLQELSKKDEMPQEGDTFIPVEEWSRRQELNKKDEDFSQEQIIYSCSKDICLSGAKLQGNILLPVDSIIKIDITLNSLEGQITTIGKVKWNKVIIENDSYEAGVEFVDAPNEAIQKLYERTQKDGAFIPKEDDTQSCRYCSREIKSDAVKCEYCGRTLSQRTTKRIFL